MTNEAVLEALDWPPSLPCESHSHKTRTYGCEDGGPATHLIVLLHPLGDEPGARTHPREAPPLQQAICTGRMIWIRSRLANHVRCVGCGSEVLLAEWIKIIGPIPEATQ